MAHGDTVLPQWVTPVPPVSAELPTYVLEGRLALVQDTPQFTLGCTRQDGTWPSPGQPWGPAGVSLGLEECYPAPTFPHKQRFLGWVAALCNGLHDQRVVVNRSFSNCQPVTSQVSQGLILGPALFNNFASGVDEGSNPADIC